jgi:hypothetical protein
MNTSTLQTQVESKTQAQSILPLNDTLAPCVLFLDFDGVTHPEPCNPKYFFSQLPLIEEVLREYPCVDVVISSSWRGTYSLQKLQSYFSPDIAPRIVGMTPSNKKPSNHWLPGHLASPERESECNDWMRQNRPWGTPFVAVDDRAHWFRPDCSELLLTRSDSGFTLADQATLRNMLAELI